MTAADRMAARWLACCLHELAAAGKQGRRPTRICSSRFIDWAGCEADRQTQTIGSHELTLGQAAEGYQNFDDRLDGWTKVILHP